MLLGWVVKFSRETNGLKYTAVTGKADAYAHTLSMSTYCESDLPPASHQRSSPPAGGTGQAGAVHQRASWWLNPITCGQRLDRSHSTIFTCVLRQVWNNIGVHGLTSMPFDSQDCSGPFDFYFISCIQLKRYIFCLCF